MHGLELKYTDKYTELQTILVDWEVDGAVQWSSALIIGFSSPLVIQLTIVFSSQLSHYTGYWMLKCTKFSSVLVSGLDCPIYWLM